MKRINLRLDVTEEERNLIRKAAALAGYRSMAEFCRAVVLAEAHKQGKQIRESLTNDSRIDSQNE